MRLGRIIPICLFWLFLAFVVIQTIAVLSQLGTAYEMISVVSELKTIEQYIYVIKNAYLNIIMIPIQLISITIFPVLIFIRNKHAFTESLFILISSIHIYTLPRGVHLMDLGASVQLIAAIFYVAFILILQATGQIRGFRDIKYTDTKIFE